MTVRAVVLCCCLAIPGWFGRQTLFASDSAFVNFETAPVHPIALSPDNSRLAVCNLADGKLEIFDVTSGHLVPLGSVPVGIDPVSVAFRSPNEVWVVNHISDSISVVDLAGLRLMATIDTLDTPEDVVFAGLPRRAFVSCARPNTVQVFDPNSRQLVTNLVIDAERPRALAVSPDGQKVYAAIFESGNATTLVGAKFRNLSFFSNAVSRTDGPYGGQNPPPNDGVSFKPPLNPALPTNPPATGIIVRKNSAGRWLDDNQRDWTEFVSGTNAASTQRVAGWDLPDRDLAIIDATDFSITYATGLMNICMALGVNPASGRVAVVGTDAINEVRFEPNLNGIFVRVKLALVNPLTASATIKDLNPHLDYSLSTLSPEERNKSIGDPRGIVWSSDGLRGYVAGMGSRNLVVLDAEGNRLRTQPIELGEGPSGLALDESRQRLYVFNRFSSSISVVDTETETVIDAVPLFDPTPVNVAAGRRHLYDTRRTSGLGQAACASCHVDARMDRLAWDLGNPAGEVVDAVINAVGGVAFTNRYHPMKGAMLTLTFQDMIGHEPFHWRGDRPDIESFNATFTNLQGAASVLTTSEMREFRDFLASIRFAPNPYRQFDNSLSTNLPLPGHIALGQDRLPAGTPLPNGNAVAGVAVFKRAESFCTTCHTLPTGLGLDAFQAPSSTLTNIPVGPNGGHHFPLAVRLEGSLASKVAQFRNLADRVGMDGTRQASRAGFGFGHDGSIDSLTRFLMGVRIVQDQDIADLIALLLSVSGSELTQSTPSFPVGLPIDLTPPASVGRQLTLASSSRPPVFDAMLTLARSPTSRVDLIAKGFQDGSARGWFYERTNDLFQSDRRLESVSPDALLALAAPGSELTFTVVARGSGVRLGIDRDLDGALDRDELDVGSNPADPSPRPRVVVPATEIAVGMDLHLDAQVPPLPAPGRITWFKDDQPLAGETNAPLEFASVSFAASGSYRFIVTTPFNPLTSEPVRITVVPLIVAVTPSAQGVRRGSNAVFEATTTGLGPFSYQWQFNGQPLANATSASLVRTNVQVVEEGSYRAVAGNAFGMATSPPVNLSVLVALTAVIPPLNQSVVEGGNATFSFLVSGHPPPFGFLLRRSSSVPTNYVSNDPMGFLTLFNVQSSNAGTYRITVTNAANPSPGLTLDPTTLTVLPDFDHDGLPDEWEFANGFATNNAADAALDFDADGQSNAAEYLAGTDARDPKSFLKVERVFVASGEAAVVQFFGVSNKTYTVQIRDGLNTGTWNRWTDVVITRNRLVSLTNTTAGAAARYYRLATPRIP